MQMARKHLLTVPSMCTRGYGIRSPEVSLGLDVLPVLLQLHQDVLECREINISAVAQPELPLQQLMWHTRDCAQPLRILESMTMSDFTMCLAALDRMLLPQLLCSPFAAHLVMFDIFRDQTTALARAAKFLVRIPPSCMYELANNGSRPVPLHCTHRGQVSQAAEVIYVTMIVRYSCVI